QPSLFEIHVHRPKPQNLDASKSIEALKRDNQSARARGFVEQACEFLLANPSPACGGPERQSPDLRLLCDRVPSPAQELAQPREVELDGGAFPARASTETCCSPTSAEFTMRETDPAFASKAGILPRV